MQRAIFAMMICSWAGGQTARPAFEAASVKPAAIRDPGHLSGGMTGGPGTGTPTRFTSTNMSLAVLLMHAYRVKRPQIVGPGWIDSECYDVAAKVAEGATPAEFRLMLQSLIEERFQLKLHHERKELPVYELVVAKGGPKLKEPGEAPAAGEPPAKKDRWAVDSDGYPLLDPESPGTSVTNGRATMYQKEYSMDELADALSLALREAVRNGTGLTGRYDIVLRWAAGGGGGPSGTASGAAESPVSGPNLFEALQQQLGLKLESKKGPVDTLVIDHAEKVPTAN